MNHTQTVLILSAGGSLAASVARAIREMHIYCEIMPSGTKAEAIRALEPIGLVLAGENFDKYPCDPEALALGLPTRHVKALPDTEGLRAFLLGDCGAKADWTAERFIEDATEKIRRQVGNGRVLLGLSGGVDSAVTAALIVKAIGNRLDCVFVDHGLMRKGEPEEVCRVFTEAFNVHLVAVDAEKRFLERLSGVTDPERKRKIIGAEFIEVFAEEARKLGKLNFLAQGTIYPDIIESGVNPGEGVVKSHHNVGGLPDDIQFDGIVEPLSMLFKDEVRAVGAALGLPETMVRRQPFPGPGLGVRVIGELTKEKLDTVRDADFILREELQRAGMMDKISQCFAVLTGVQSVGVRGGVRAYDHVICLRAVRTVDFMTAEWVPIPYEIIAKISERITGEVAGVSRVVLDVTSKPPAAIEWE